MRTRRLGVIAPILIALSVPSVAVADETFRLLCPLVLQQEQVDREEIELEIELADSRLAAAESIFALVDQLWETHMVERLVYLAAKHGRDVAEIEVKRQRLLEKRQEAEIEQFEIVCSGKTSGLEEARRRYRQADCHRIGKDLAIAEVDLAYRSEVLESIRDLRESNVTTQQAVIRAERDVELARERVDHQRRRVEACVASGIAG